DYRDAVFWDALLPDGWRTPGAHHAYQEAIVDGRGVPLGPAWCARDRVALARELASTRVTLSVNGEPVDLARLPRTRRRMRVGALKRASRTRLRDTLRTGSAMTRRLRAASHMRGSKASAMSWN